MLCFFVEQILLDTQRILSVDFIIIFISLFFFFLSFFSHNDFLEERGVEYDHGIKL